MTTSSTEQVGDLGEEATAMEIDGFQGRLITADHPTTTPPEPCGTAPSTGAPG